MLMSSKYKNFSDEPLLAQDYSLFELNNLFIGISTSFENIYEFRNYYDQAVTVLNEGIKNPGGKWVFLHS